MNGVWMHEYDFHLHCEKVMLYILCQLLQWNSPGWKLHCISGRLWLTSLKGTFLKNLKLLFPQKHLFLLISTLFRLDDLQRTRTAPSHNTTGRTKRQGWNEPLFAITKIKRPFNSNCFSLYIFKDAEIESSFFTILTFAFKIDGPRMNFNISRAV